jgi:hypothetical protein
MTNRKNMRAYLRQGFQISLIKPHILIYFGEREIMREEMDCDMFIGSDGFVFDIIRHKS